MSQVHIELVALVVAMHVSFQEASYILNWVNITRTYTLIRGRITYFDTPSAFAFATSASVYTTNS